MTCVGLNTVPAWCRPFQCLSNGQQERVSFDKITSRINKLCYGLDRDFIDPVIISQKVVQVRVISAARMPYVCALL